MQHYIVQIKSIDKLTHDVLRFVTEKPEKYTFTPGQATEVSINKEGWKDEKRPFTFTCLPNDKHLEFVIKIYPPHDGVTEELLQLTSKDELILHDVFGAIEYKGEGVFIAGGAGITPFISIFRDLASKNELGNNRLIFANQKQEDIILEEEFRNLLGANFINILSDENVAGYANGFITADFLKANSDGINQYFYLCGPPPMIEAVEEQLADLQVNKNLIVKESF